MSRALHVLGSLHPGGVERWLRDTVRFRGESRWRFDFCLLGDDAGAYAGEVEALGCGVLRCPLRSGAPFPARLFALLRRGRYEVVHSHVHLFSGVVLAVARVAGVPVRVAHSHTIEAAGEGLLRRAYRRTASELLRGSMTLGIACASGAAGFAGKALRPRFRVLRCGIDVEAFRRACGGRPLLRRQFGLPEDAAVLGHVGRLEAEKNQAFLLRAAARLISRVPRARLMIVGGGSLRAELESLSRRLGLRERVIFTGPCDDIPRLSAVFDAFALPSLREGLPLTLLEAQAAGFPCVVSEHAPDDAVVAPGLVERVGIGKGPEAWADALARALERPRGDRDDACRRLRLLGFDVRDAFAMLTRTYEQSLAETQPGKPSTQPAAWSPFHMDRG